MSFKQPDKKETGKAWAAFVAYRDLGNDRSYQKVSEQLSKSATLIKRWAKKFGWKARIVKYEAYIQGVELQSYMDHRWKAKTKLLKNAQFLQNVGIKELVRRVKEEEISTEKLRDIMSMIKTGSDVEIKLTGLEELPLPISDSEDVNSFSFLKKIYDEVHSQDGIKKQVRRKARKPIKPRRTDTGKSNKTKGRKVPSSVVV
jgi:hypothetical protein